MVNLMSSIVSVGYPNCKKNAGLIECFFNNRVASKICSTRMPLSMASKIFCEPLSAPIQTTSQPDWASNSMVFSSSNKSALD